MKKGAFGMIVAAFFLVALPGVALLLFIYLYGPTRQASLTTPTDVINTLIASTATANVVTDTLITSTATATIMTEVSIGTSIITSTTTNLLIPPPIHTLTPTLIATISLPIELELPTITSTSMPVPTVRPELRVTVRAANLRSGPGTNYDKIGTLPVGSVVLILARTSDYSWYNVQLDNGVRAWIGAEVVEPVDTLVLTMVPIAISYPQVGYAL
jgi:hypothetical protein